VLFDGKADEPVATTVHGREKREKRAEYKEKMVEIYEL